MKYYLKQFTEWVTALTHNPFERARVKLTLFYVGTMITIMGIFSLVLIATLEKNIQDSLEDITGGNPLQHMALVRAKDTIETVVYTIDSILILFIGGVGYFLAGRTLRPIQQSLDRQKRFTADASHDLRTPLAIMKTEIEVALQNNHADNSTYRKTLKSGLEEIQTMSLLVEDLLTLARTENKNKDITKMYIDYQDVLNKLVERTQKQVNEKSISVELDIKDTGKIYVHEHSFTRALQNIVQNAIRYTKSDGVISITLARIGKHFTLAIKDTGVGISQKDLPYVFDRFYKASHSRNDQAGSGLGLSIAKEIIEMYDGSLSIESNEGKGTTVTIVMPA